MFGIVLQLDTSCVLPLLSGKIYTSVLVADGGGCVGVGRRQDGRNLVDGLCLERSVKERVDKKVNFHNGVVWRPGEEGRGMAGGGPVEPRREVVEGEKNLDWLADARRTGKWRSYGGCIPSMLLALDRIDDIDEALRQWEDTLSNKERSIILKEQSSWLRALEIFRWFKQKGSYEINVIHYNILLKILGKAQRWDELENMWSDMERNKIIPTNATYGTLIDVYSKGGLKEEALLWLDKMQKQGLQPDEVTMGIVVQTYKKLGDFEKADRFYKEWLSGKMLRNLDGASQSQKLQPQKCTSSYTYNTLIDTYGKAGQLREASDTFRQMLKEGIFPTTVTFNTMIHLCGTHGHLDEVVGLIAKMEELRCPPDTRTFNILIILFDKYGNINKAVEYFEQMKKYGLQPDNVSYRILLCAFSVRHMVGPAEELVSEMDERGLEIDESTQTALTRMYLDAGFPDKSWLWFERFHCRQKMSPECYAATIDAFGKRGHFALAEKAFHCCLRGRNLSVLEFNVMIKAYGQGAKYDKACQLFDSLEKYGVSPDKCTYNCLIQILSGAGHPYQAWFYLRKMQEAGWVQDCVPYCAVISSFAKHGELVMAEELFKNLVSHGVQPDIMVFGVLINAFAELGSVNETTKYVQMMKEAGFSGNSVIYNSLIKLYTKVGYLQEAEDIYHLLHSSEGGPDVYSSNCMIHLYSERSMVRKAERVFENMKEKGKANEFSYAKMLCMYKRLGRFSDANGLAQDMNQRGLVSDAISYNIVIGLHVSEGRFREAYQLFCQMIDSGVQPDNSTFRSLRTLLIKYGVSKVAVNKLEISRKKDGQCGVQAWIATLDSMIGLRDDATL